MIRPPPNESMLITMIRLRMTAAKSSHLSRLLVVIRPKCLCSRKAPMPTKKRVIETVASMVIRAGEAPPGDATSTIIATVKSRARRINRTLRILLSVFLP